MTKVLSVLFASFLFVGSAGASSLPAVEAIIGVGMILTEDSDGRIMVEGVVAKSPAEHSNQIKAGDELLQVMPLPDTQWIEVTGMDLDYVVGLIRGEAGTEVGLLIREGSGGATKDVDLKREKLTVEE